MRHACEHLNESFTTTKNAARHALLELPDMRYVSVRFFFFAILKLLFCRYLRMLGGSVTQALESPIAALITHLLHHPPRPRTSPTASLRSPTASLRSPTASLSACVHKRASTHTNSAHGALRVFPPSTPPVAAAATSPPPPTPPRPQHTPPPRRSASGCLRACV